MSNTWGGARPGAGRKSHAHIRHCHELLQQASTDEDYVRGFRELFAIWKNDDVTRPYAKPRESIEAAKVILRYAFGIPEPEEPEPQDEIQPSKSIEICCADAEPAPKTATAESLELAPATAVSFTPSCTQPQPAVLPAPSESAPIFLSPEPELRSCPEFLSASASSRAPNQNPEKHKDSVDNQKDSPAFAPILINQQIPSYVIAQYDSLEAIRAAFPDAPEIRNLSPEDYAAESSQSHTSPSSPESPAPRPYSRLRDRRRRMLSLQQTHQPAQQLMETQSRGSSP